VLPIVLRNGYKLLENLKGQDHLGCLGIDWRIIKWVFQEVVCVVLGTGFICPRIGTSGGLL